jgi:hypothetical protein
MSATTDKDVKRKKSGIEYKRNAAGEFVCPDCGKTARRHNTMFYHMKSHATTMDHTCSVCSKGFIQKGGLQQHMAQVHPELAEQDDSNTYAHQTTQCPCCDQVMRIRSNLFIHITRKHGNGWVVAPQIVADANTKKKQWVCAGTNCGRSFASSPAFYYHAMECFGKGAPTNIKEALCIHTG